MSQNEFILALGKSLQKDYRELIQSDIPQYEVSDKFKKKMEKLIKYQRKPYFRLTCTAGRRAACIIVAVIVLSVSSLSVDAVYNTIYNFIVKTFSDHDEISYNNDSDSYPETIEDEYVISNIPEGFELTDHDLTEKSVYSSYLNEDKCIVLEQCTKDFFSYNYDNEYSMTENYTDENGQEYIIRITDSTDITVLWDNGEYIFQIYSNLDKDSVLDLCKNVSVKPKM